MYCLCSSIFPHKAPMLEPISDRTSAIVSKLGDRRTGNYRPNGWNYQSLLTLRSGYTEVFEERQRNLEEYVRRMFRETNHTFNLLQLLDDIERLGMGYLFENEIEQAMNYIYFDNKSNTQINKDLYVTSIKFKNLRNHGFDVDPGVFEHFMDENGQFKTSLVKDMKGMLALYEASHLSFKGENILDEARSFTKKHIMDNKNSTSSNFARQITRALDIPEHWSPRWVESRIYVDTYGTKDNKNPIIHELAILNFNKIQSVHQEELKREIRWWTTLGLIDHLPFARDRMMECYLGIVGDLFQPKYAYLRRVLCKIVSLATVLDDIYDIYATMDELKIFTLAISRWDINGMETLPEYMKIIISEVFSTTNEVAQDILKEHGLHVLLHLKKGWLELCEAFLKERKWYEAKYTPTTQEYIDNAWISIAGPLDMTYAFFILNPNVSEDVLQTLENYSLLIKSSSLIFRLCNDLASQEEQERGDTPGYIQCYMLEKGVSESVAREYVKSLTDYAWKEMNEQCFLISRSCQPFVDFAQAMARTARWIYLCGDRLVSPDSEMKGTIKSLLVEPIPLQCQTD